MSFTHGGRESHQSKYDGLIAQILTMTKANKKVAKNFAQDSTLLNTIQRIRLRHNYFSVMAYKLANGQTAITTRQMAIAVQKPPKCAKEFIRKVGVRPVKVQMPNRCVADMIPVSVAAAFWKHLNESGKGNVFTLLGQQYLDNYSTDSI